MTPEEARRRFASVRVARLATADADGRPHLVPVTFAIDGDRILTAIDAKPKRSTELRRLANIRENEFVCLLVDGYDDDWSRLWWARADGLARVVEDGPELAALHDLLRDRYPQYATVAIDGPGIVVEVERWSGWAASTAG